jgi:hypothetical protein
VQLPVAAIDAFRDQIDWSRSDVGAGQSLRMMIS